jgi:uncharacterized OB-fold protein/putative sterol carrier protein
MIFEGRIEIPYRWTTGPAMGRFLTELRDNKKIVGLRCGRCGRIYVPPPDVCGPCFAPMDDWVELGPGGLVTSFSRVNYPLPWRPVGPPYTLALIRLDGADTDLLHLVEADEVRVDMRVKPWWNAARTGSVLDIRAFVPEEQPIDSDFGERALDMERNVSEVEQVFLGLEKYFKPGAVSKPLSFYFSLDEEKWTVFVSPDKCEIKQGKATDAADCVLKTTPELFMKVMRGQYTPGAMDFMTGKIRSNAPQLLRELVRAFGIES